MFTTLKNSLKIHFILWVAASVILSISATFWYVHWQGYTLHKIKKEEVTVLDTFWAISASIIAFIFIVEKLYRDKVIGSVFRIFGLILPIIVARIYCILYSSDVNYIDCSQQFSANVDNLVNVVDRKSKEQVPFVLANHSSDVNNKAQIVEDLKKYELRITDSIVDAQYPKSTCKLWIRKNIDSSLTSNGIYIQYVKYLLQLREVINAAILSGDTNRVEQIETSYRIMPYAEVYGYNPNRGPLCELIGTFHAFICRLVLGETINYTFFSLLKIDKEGNEVASLYFLN